MLIATSWDDGLVTDLELIRVLERHSVRASFSINSRLHQNTPILNDPRYAEYGLKVAAPDLIAFEPYDICNHTSTHGQMDVLTPQFIESEIKDGKQDLEGIFNKEVSGIVWPFGVSTPESIEIAKMAGHSYGRVTSSPTREPTIKSWNVVPINWRTSPEEVINVGQNVVISGHTYEMRDQSDWDLVNEMYRIYSTDERCTLVTMTELLEITGA